MPVLLKELKRELQDDRKKVGRNPDGSYKSMPTILPNIVGRTVKDYTTLPLDKISTQASEKDGTVRFTALVASETTGVKYMTKVKFFDMDFKKIQSAQYKNKAGNHKKQYVYYRTPNANVNSVQLRCNCMDFQHRFMHPLAIFDALIGMPIELEGGRKTGKWPVGRPEVNVTDKIGFCKHVANLLTELKKKNLVNEVPVIL